MRGWSTKEARRMGRLGGLRRWATEPDRRAALEPARRGLIRKYEDEARAAAEARGEALSRAEIRRRADTLRRLRLHEAWLAWRRRRSDEPGADEPLA